MGKTLKYTLYTAALSAAFVNGFSSLAFATNSGSVKTVANCGNVNDNQFTAGDQVLGKGDHFESSLDYRWTIVKVDNPGQGTQVADGSFSLGSGVTTFCINLTTASITSGDTHSEYKWEVEKKETNNQGNVSWKKVDSDNYFVDSASQTQPTATPTTAPTATATPTPTTAQVTPTVTPTPTTSQSNTQATVTPTATPTDTPTSTPTPTSGTTNSSATPTPTTTQDILSSGASTVNSDGKVQGIQATLGTTTMAATGTFENALMNSLFTTGMMILGLSAVSYAKEKKA